MRKGIITRHKNSIGERKDIENALATREKKDAVLDYIIACDYLEILGNTSEASKNE